MTVLSDPNDPDISTKNAPGSPNVAGSGVPADGAATELGASNQPVGSDRAVDVSVALPPAATPDDLLPPLYVAPLAQPPDAVVQLPGSKSLTNRALLAAALAAGESRLIGLLDSDDTEAMRSCLESTGVHCRDGHVVGTGDVVRVTGCAGKLGPQAISVDVRQSGTTARFITPMLALSSGASQIDGHPQMRSRPMNEQVDALEALGAGKFSSRSLPLISEGGGVDGGSITISGSTSSQFLSGLLLSSPYFAEGLDVTIDGALVSRPYVDLTIDVMSAFGVSVARDGYQRFVVRPGGYTATTFRIEPDASTASYFFACAAMTQGRVLVQGLGSSSAQGDMGFLDILEDMGAVVRQGSDWTEVVGRGLRGVDVDMSDVSDTAPTLAVVATRADSPTRIRNIGFVRGKESDRIQVVVTELQRLGIEARAHHDGLTIVPGVARPGTVQTYQDHRIAMAFALLGLTNDGIKIADPTCVNKTFPGFWDTLGSLRRPSGSDSAVGSDSAAGLESAAGSGAMADSGDRASAESLGRFGGPGDGGPR